MHASDTYYTYLQTRGLRILYIVYIYMKSRDDVENFAIKKNI